MERSLKPYILKDLDHKMVLLLGPRQSGKTWLAKEIGATFNNSLYLNYDSLKDREMIKRQSWFGDIDCLILDELHKMPDWKNYLKGLYDTRPPTMRILVTGSARLSIYDQVGDSLAGRYFQHHLMPLTHSECRSTEHTTECARLLERGGFPEPFLAADGVQAERWRQQYTLSLLSTDIFEVNTIHNLKGMRTLFELLRLRVGSPVSYKSLSEDMGVSPTTVKKYIDILEAVYVVFPVRPYAKNIARSLLKEPKIYFYDTGLVPIENTGARLENMVAVELLTHCHRVRDLKARSCGLYYLRTKDGEEVDFALAKSGEVRAAIEVKVSDQTPSKSLLMFQKKYGFPSTQLVYHLDKEHVTQGVMIRKVERFLSDLKTD